MAGAGLYDPRFEHDACGVGFVADLSGRGGHEVVARALRVLRNLEHRGAKGGDPGTGDGAGILTQIPDEFFRATCDFELPEAGAYAAGMAFLSAERHLVTPALARLAAAEGLTILGWREVPFDVTACGYGARAVLPDVLQLFVAGAGGQRGLELERMAFCLRKRAEHEAGVYFASLSARTIVYKGMLSAPQLGPFYPDLSDSRYGSALALVHSRFSTNTFPSWPLAHPYRYVCHNGEINTLRGNLTWMRVRESCIASDLFGADVAQLFPVVSEGQSDSACFDNVLELLVQAGRPLAHAMMMLMPEAWEGDETMPPERRAFYEYHSALLEPWDGPAAMAFTDGRQIGAVLDRNGLRPARYVVTTDDLVVLASEAGALPIPVERIRAKGRLEPGKMLVVNTTTGIVPDDEAIKTELAMVRPYHRWISEQRIDLEELITEREAEGGRREAGRSASGEPSPLVPRPSHLFPLPRAFRYTTDEIKMVLGPMADAGEEPAGSMGNDTPLAVLSQRPQLLFSYFRQMFAQVTNPAIDPMRYQLVTSLAMNLGPQGNLLEVGAEHARQIRIAQPVLTEQATAALQDVSEPSLRAVTLSTLFLVADGTRALEPGVDALCLSARDAVAA